MHKMPLNGFRWLTKSEVRQFNIQGNYDGDVGYFVECDLHYPKHLHKAHSNLPLAPEVLEVGFDNLSPYAKAAIEKTEGCKRYQDTKLMSTFHDRIGYVTHIKNLQLYLSLGMVLSKTYRILEFKQDYVLGPYIQVTTAARQKATSKFEMDLFKKLVSKNFCCSS